ncbi:hypothetical protein CEXT_721441 [Caerostris extrusa]|uniref:Uncharacterized protein n=1 Tax=Caerostris extrusa TaxID=172846 RepID=A0AAV4RZ23_CAEEX|nr:hypothetical protein CEXT_721441 [Caerostris extrusa]
MAKLKLFCAFHPKLFSSDLKRDNLPLPPSISISRFELSVFEGGNLEAFILSSKAFHLAQGFISFDKFQKELTVNIPRGITAENLVFEVFRLSGRLVSERGKHEEYCSGN